MWRQQKSQALKFEPGSPSRHPISPLEIARRAKKRHLDHTILHHQFSLGAESDHSSDWETIEESDEETPERWTNSPNLEKTTTFSQMNLKRLPSQAFQSRPQGKSLIAQAHQKQKSQEKSLANPHSPTKDKEMGAKTEAKGKEIVEVEEVRDQSQMQV